MKTPAIQFRSYQKRAFCNRTNGIGIRHGERHTNNGLMARIPLNPILACSFSITLVPLNPFTAKARISPSHDHPGLKATEI